MEAVKLLTPSQRADLVYQVLLTLDQDSPSADLPVVEAEWRNETRRRVDDYLSGNTNLMSVKESHAKVRAKLDASRV